MSKKKKTKQACRRTKSQDRIQKRLTALEQAFGDFKTDVSTRLGTFPFVTEEPTRTGE